MTRSTVTDYLVEGAGAMGMAFTDVSLLGEGVPPDRIVWVCPRDT